MKNEIKLALDELIKRYNITNEEEIKTLKSGIEFLNDAVTIKDNESRYRICTALIEYLIYKRAGVSNNDFKR